jgi:hypothetical protein
MPSLTSAEVIASRILIIRGKRVMLDTDLAVLYGVKTGRLNEQVSRNIKRFPEDFMFQLAKEETLNLKSHFATSSWGGVRKLPRVFTQEGVAMLSSVLNSEKAIQVNIAIMRAFVKLRQVISTHKGLVCKLRELEEKIEKHDTEIRQIFEAIRQLMQSPKKPKRKIGFHNS